MTCSRTLKDLVDHLACSLNDREGSELARLASKQCVQDSIYDTGEDGLNDLDNSCEDELNHIRWSESFLTSVINDGYRILHLERPDLFTSRVRHKLTPGCSVQEVPSTCKFAGGLRNSSCDSDSEPVAVSETQSRISERLGLYFCSGSTSSTNSSYTVTGVNFNPKNPNEFIVTPTPPVGVDSYVTFNCVSKPPCFNWDSDKDEEVGIGLFDDYEPWFIEYALFRSHISDRESESSRELATIHWTTGLKLISQGKMADYTFYHPDLYLMGPIAEGTGERIVLQSE